jgi:dinuclear metal center YbgI/SA1388 family protein
MQLKELIDFLEEIAPPRFQESYDNAGLIVGHPSYEVSGVLVALDSTEEIVDEALANGCNVIIAHHPIIFSGLKKINGYNYIEKTIIKAIKNDIAIYAIHTNLDNVLKNGVNAKIAEKIGLERVELLAPKEELSAGNYQIGSGAIGLLAQPMSGTDFLPYLKEKMELSVVRHTELLSSSIQKVAVCGGSGRFLLDMAIAKGADVFISSDFKYHEFFDANQEILIADIGHYESEKYTIDLLQQLINENFSTFAARKTEKITNPIKYF